MPVTLMPITNGRRIVLDKAVVFIGRHPDCDVVLTRSRKVSRKHCCIAQVENRFIIRDLGSMNGVRVNGVRVRKQARVKIGDEVAIGDVFYVLESIADKKPDNSKTIRGNRKDAEATRRRRGDGTDLQEPPLNVSQDMPVVIPDPHEVADEVSGYAIHESIPPEDRDSVEEDDVIILEEQDERLDEYEEE